MNARTNRTDMTISWIVRVQVEATDCNTASIETMIISSITVMPKRRDETSLFVIPNSCKTQGQYYSASYRDRQSNEETVK